MGTYTSNYNLFMPSIGEQGWGTLVNTNFSTIDDTMKRLDMRLITCESTDVAYNTRLETLEAGEFDTITANSITADIFSGNMQGNSIGLLFVPGVVQSSAGDVAYATVENQTFAITASHTASNPYTVAVKTPTIVYDLPHKHMWGVYTRLEDLSGTTSVTDIKRSVWLSMGNDRWVLYYKLSSESTYSHVDIAASGETLTLTVGKTYNMYAVIWKTNSPVAKSWTFNGGTLLYVKYATP